MKVAIAERLFCDTNVLLCAVDRKRALHQRALWVLNEIPRQGAELCVSGQVIREFLVACTRPVDVNGLGLAPDKALDNASAIVERTTILDEPREVVSRLLRISRQQQCRGKRFHDANIVAVMREHDVQRLITDNVSDFRAFADIDIVELDSIPCS